MCIRDRSASASEILSGAIQDNETVLDLEEAWGIFPDYTIPSRNDVVEVIPA